MFDVISSCIVACLARCLLNEGARCSSEKQAKTHEGTIATRRNAATWERGCHNAGLLKSITPNIVKTRMPIAISTRVSQKWYDTDRHEQRKRAT